MDVPFSSSGALSRAHYVIVRKVESATSSQAADQHLAAEIKSIRRQLAHPALDLKACKECLIILLYCSMAITSGLLDNGYLDFALSHALVLAEAGTTVEDKRIGYMFCSMIMSAEHELRLMLVNTLRKDLEDSSVPRICLALDSLISLANEDLIPAVQSRLHDLLLHNYPHVRRRALLALRSLSRYEPQLLTRATSTIQKRLKDPDPSVASSALIFASDIPDTDPKQHDIHDMVNNMLQGTLSTLHKTSHKTHWFILRILQTLLTMRSGKLSYIISFSNTLADFLKEISPSCLISCKVSQVTLVMQVCLPRILLQMYKAWLFFFCKGIILGIFRNFSLLSPEMLLSKEKSQGISAVRCIKGLLTSQNPNDQYLFLSCLECLDPMIWAGTTAEYPTILDASEVGRVMEFLDAPDHLMRKKTMEILNRIDSNILSAYYTQALQSIPTGLTIMGQNAFVVRLLEIPGIQHKLDGGEYGRKVKEIFAQLETRLGEGQHRILEDAVEVVLVYIRTSDLSFRLACVATLITMFIDSDTLLEPTFMVIVSALAAEYCGVLSIPPAQMLLAFSVNLKAYSPVVQDTCIAAMLRIAADCDGKIAEEVISSVSEVRQNAGRHIQRRCDQFLAYSVEGGPLKAAVRNATSSSLPDFLQALQLSEEKRPQSPSSSSPRLASSTTVGSSGKLRYTAYDRPQAIPSLRVERPHSSLSDVGTTNSFTLESLPAINLAVGSQLLEGVPGVPSEHEGSREDLITLDSPFVSDAQGGTDGAGFAEEWDSLAKSVNARGWCSETVDEVTRQLGEMEGCEVKVVGGSMLPFIGRSDVA
ncbi:uncharacterized protein LACBIDRAFT_296456 [Laccaria bicolor S238N-H82]|uniref:Predicted protein n=1 Tax=Laccaria bicolor (strain S238N-H82 / ATCC MYA-4686) TaxID=486041 RepID=B0D8V2_LACBS|nr:uncharacterized protein LACBIDRAFT_296456 [Laccaria bicolor S238N-H82]EDR09136.1 predicted protein [Laccaria bicolor S238N-H82]|eukprot:XP_001880449.1 predicted protein [Laccaria bicolor S238N-H82]